MKPIHLLDAGERLSCFQKALEAQGLVCTRGMDIPVSCKYVVDPKGDTPDVRHLLDAIGHLRRNDLQEHDTPHFHVTLRTHYSPGRVIVQSSGLMSPADQKIVQAAVGAVSMPQSAAVCLRCAVAVTCHTAYMPLLAECLQALDAQTYPPAQRFLALDGCELSRQQEYDLRARGWQIRIGNWHSPNPGRQWALETTDCDWIMHVDADDPHRPDYLAGAVALTGDPRIGIVHANRSRTDGTVIETPSGHDYWRLRLRNYVDTSSLWRVTALREAGGWAATQRYDDWDCALRVTSIGWQTIRNSVPSICRVHADCNNRNARYKDFYHKWHRSYAIVAMLAGRRGSWDDWRRLALATEFPLRSHWYLLDNSRDPAFAAEVRTLAADLSAAGYTATVLRDDRTFAGNAKEDRHRHVAALYNRVLPLVAEDVTLFWEDDVLPLPEASVRILVDHWDCWLTGGICALYESRDVRGHACAARGMDYWHDMPSLAEVRGKFIAGLGYLPGGFALYNTAFVRQALPFWLQFPGGKMQGWDAQLSRCIRTAGWRLDLDGLVECEHRTQGTR